MRIPYLTLILCSLTFSLMLLPIAVQANLHFNVNQLLLGHWQGLITGHWLHSDFQHMAWNVSALAILGAIIEQRSRSLLVWTFAIGMLCVDLLLLSPLSELQKYCGLSGVLNTLLGVALYLRWRETASHSILFLALLCMAKIAFEIQSGQAIFTESAWPPFAKAHLAGILGVPLALICGAKGKYGLFQRNNNKDIHHEHLVSS